MPLIALKCPECNGDIQLDDAREFGFCMYCGCKVFLERTHPAKNPGPDIRNVLVLAADALESRDWESAAQRIEQALVIDIGCPDAWYMKALVSWAAGDGAAASRAILRGRAAEKASLGIFSLDDYDRIRGRRVTFRLDRGIGHADTVVIVEFPWEGYVLEDELEVMVPLGAHWVVFTEVDEYDEVQSRAQGEIVVEGESAYRVRTGLRGLRVDPLRPGVVCGEAAQPPSLPSAGGARFPQRRSALAARRRRRPGGNHFEFLELWLSARHPGLTSAPPSGISQPSAPTRSAGTLVPPASSPA